MMFRRLWNLGSLLLIATEQQAVISDQRRIITRQQAEIEKMKLEHIRTCRDLVEQFWIAEVAGTDVREELQQGLSDLRDHVARLEEHVR